MKKEYLGVEIDYSRDDNITEFGKKTLEDRYYSNDEKSPQEAFARAAVAFADDLEHAQRIYDYVSKLWFMYATPVLSNGGLKRGQPISCFLSYVPDSRKGLSEHYDEIIWLASNGGGIGGYWGDLRTDGIGTSNGSVSGGAMPFIKVVDSLTLSTSQGKTRRGSYACYMDISHPEIEEFISMRKPTGGDTNRKSLNLHHGVNITDSFMQILEKCMKEENVDDTWELIDPKTKKVVKKVSAKKLWQYLLETRMQTGEPYIHYIDTSNEFFPEEQKKLNLSIKQSNLCVAPETLVLTDKGHLPIIELEGRDVNVWNGEEFTNVKVVKTGLNQQLDRIEFSDGAILEVTPYHKFYVKDDYKKTTIVKRAHELKVGDKLINFDKPVIEFDKELDNAYEKGFLLSNQKLEDYSLLPMQYSISSKVKWLEGLFDGASSCIKNNEGGVKTLQISGCIKNLSNIRLMLQTMGVSSFIVPIYENTNILILNENNIKKLVDIGFKINITLEHINQYEDCAEVSVIHRNVRKADTFCFTEEKRGMGVFNGVITGNCSEIIEATDEFRTAVCCLSSVNLEKFDEWENHDKFIPDLIRFLDNILTHFMYDVFDQKSFDEITEMYENDKMDIHRMRDLAKPGMSGLVKAAWSAYRERSLGLGSMGFHAFLQKKNLPFESALASSLNRRMFENIKTKALEETKRLALEKGEAPDMKGSGKRNAHLMAIAPNASSSIICGSSPSIEPIRANAYTHKTLSGSFLVKNKFLEKLLEEKGKNTKEVWKSIIENNGAVQHLEFLSDWEKDVYKTALELDQLWLIEHAADRQKHICQAQSLNLFFSADEDIKYLHDVHFRAWKTKLKTLYYCRSETIYRVENVNVKIERQKIEDHDDVCLACEG